jgi:hypothetical protein
LHKGEIAGGCWVFVFSALLLACGSAGPAHASLGGELDLTVVHDRTLAGGGYHLLAVHGGELA